MQASCQECKSTLLTQNTKQGNIVCQACGLVQSSRIIDETAEWRNFGSDNAGNDNKADMNRVGGKTNPFLSNSGLDTSVKGTNAAQYQKWLIKSQYHSMTSKDKSITTCMKFLTDLKERLNIHQESIYAKACEILKRIEDSGIAKNQRINVKCATIMFVACRVTNNPMDLVDILKATGTGQKDISKFYKRMKSVLPGA